MSDEIIKIRSMTLRDRFLCLIWPAYRHRNEAIVREIIHRLVKDPTLPCMIDGRVIPHGYGADPGRDEEPLRDWRVT